MPYKITGTLNDSARIIVIEEDSWTIESNDVSAPTSYEALSLASGTKLVVARANSGEVLAYGAAPSVYYAPILALRSWGYNNTGELGLGDIVSRSVPVQIGSLTDWSEVSGGELFTCAAKTDGSMWSWGSNGNGQLGLEDTTNRSSPVQVGSLTDWSKISCGDAHTLSIKMEGTLWSWGKGFFGQLGTGTTKRSSPTQVGLATNWDSAVGGSNYSLGTQTDGTLWAWGYNNFGQLGLGDVTQRNAPVQVGALTDWKMVSAATSANHTSAVKTDGTLWIWEI